MKFYAWRNAVVASFLLLVSACGNEQRLQRQNGVIIIQPLNNYDTLQMIWLQKDVSSFFQIPVIFSGKTSIPVSYINFEKGRRFDASQIIDWLSKGRPDSVIAVAGITHEDIYVSKKDKSGKIKSPESTYRVWGIFGLGFCPGKSCVISDKRLFTADHAKFRRRLRTVVIHEIGHNLGLPHCSQKHCIMNDANESIRTVDQSGKDYCNNCNRKIGRHPSVLSQRKI